METQTTTREGGWTDVSDRTKTLSEFFADFVERNKVPHGGGFHLVVTDEDCMQLGEFLIRGIIGWASAYDIVPRLRSQHLVGIAVEERITDEPEFIEDEFDDEDTVIH